MVAKQRNGDIRGTIYALHKTICACLATRPDTEKGRMQAGDEKGFYKINHF